MIVSLEDFLMPAEYAAKKCMLEGGGVPHILCVMMRDKSTVDIPCLEYFTFGAISYGVPVAMAVAGLSFGAKVGCDIIAVYLLAPGEMDEQQVDRETNEEKYNHHSEAFCIIAVDVSNPGHRRSLIVSYEVVRAGGSVDIFNRHEHKVEEGDETSGVDCPPLDAFLEGVALYKKLNS